MKKYFLIAAFMLSGLASFSQGTIQLNLKWNSSASRYEVYARPNFTLSNFPWGPSQISVVVPNSSPDASLGITSIAAGSWTDNSKVYTTSATVPAQTNDFHGVESNGSSISLTSGVETLIFTFIFNDGQCRDGVRLFVNNSDPGSNVSYMNGGDFRNSISNASLQDVYLSNYDNTGTICNPCNVVAPELIK